MILEYYLEKLSRSIYLGPQCALACLGCALEPLKNDPISEIEQLPKWISKVHIGGGDPFSSPLLAQVLQTLARCEKRGAIWTPALVSGEHFEAVFPFVDEFFVYVPTPIPLAYASYTGQDSFHKLRHAIDFLREHNRRVTLVHRVMPDTISFLPELHDMTRYSGLRLLFHYSRADGFTKNEVGYIRRYHRIKNCHVVTRWRPEMTRCFGFPGF